MTALGYRQFRQAAVYAAAAAGNGNLRRCWGCNGYLDPPDPPDPRETYCAECRECGRTRGGRRAGHAERVEATHAGI